MPLLTVGLPVYNAMPYLPEAITSLLCQTYRDFEILAIDDGSTDDSLAYLKSIRDPRLKVLSQENRGITATLNRMLTEVSTPWLVRQDADDIALPHRLAITADYIRARPDAGMFYSYAQYLQNGRIFGSFRTTVASPAELRSFTRAGYLLAICHPTVTLNVNRTMAVGGYRFNLHVEDVDLWWRMAMAYDICLMPIATVAVRHNTASVSAKHFTNQCINTLFVQYLLLAHLRKCEPLPYEAVHDVLAKLVDRKQVLFRKHARLANIHLSGQRYGSVVKHVALAFLSSPTRMANRILYEFGHNTTALNGEDPSRFATQWSAAVANAANRN